MPQHICQLCFDKINDFYEFRGMCEATTIQTRKLLGLPELRSVVKKEPDDFESILGDLAGDGLTKSNLKTNSKTKASKARQRKSIKLKQEIHHESDVLPVESILISDEDSDYTPKVKKNRTKGKGSIKDNLLAPKPLNKREKQRQIEQKKTDKKRKTDERPATVIQKQVKKEKTVTCDICYADFERIQAQISHKKVHKPCIANFGCSSCCESFDNQKSYKEHHNNHHSEHLPYNCNNCGECFLILEVFNEHVANCILPYYETVNIVANIFCNQCKQEFETKNLYDWHKCFIDDKKSCPKCNRIFLRGAILFKHIFSCKAKPLSPSEVVVQIPANRTSGRTTRNSQISKIKTEPEFDSSVTDGDDLHGFDGTEPVIESHFGDDNDSDSEDENPTTSTANTTKVTHSDIPLCRVKLESLDLPALPNSSIEKVITPSTKHTVTPQTSSSNIHPNIRIKKEIVNPDYRDVVFDSNLARNIKREREWDSNSDNPPQKVYKKPAMLAIKIKQERMEWKDQTEESDNNVITNIPNSSLVDNNDQFPIIENVLDGNTLTTVANINTILPSIPFTPIKIKSEFRGFSQPANLETEKIVSMPSSSLSLTISNVVSLNAPEDIENVTETNEISNETSNDKDTEAISSEIENKHPDISQNVNECSNKNESNKAFNDVENSNQMENIAQEHEEDQESNQDVDSTEKNSNSSQTANEDNHQNQEFDRNENRESISHQEENEQCESLNSNVALIENPNEHNEIEEINTEQTNESDIEDEQHESSQNEMKRLTETQTLDESNRDVENEKTHENTQNNHEPPIFNEKSSILNEPNNEMTGNHHNDASESIETSINVEKNNEFNEIENHMDSFDAEKIVDELIADIQHQIINESVNETETNTEFIIDENELLKEFDQLPFGDGTNNQ